MQARTGKKPEGATATYSLDGQHSAGMGFPFSILESLTRPLTEPLLAAPPKVPKLSERARQWPQNKAH